MLKIAGKNAYAVSVLERVEWKLDGLDNDGRRYKGLIDSSIYWNK
jgi:hypothetical protein